METGFAFQLEKLWREPDLFGTTEDESILFKSSDVSILPFQLQNIEPKHPWNSLEELAPLHKLAPLNLNSPASKPGSHRQTNGSGPSDPENRAEEPPTSLWPLEDLSEVKVDILDRSWEGFTARYGTYKPATTTKLLSEAGIDAFDAVIKLRKTLKQPDHPVKGGILDHTTVHRALCNLILGRSSVLFSWSDRAQRFTPTVPDLQISGLSEKCAQDFTNELCDFGAHLRRLKYESRTNITKEAFHSRTDLALKCCVAEILDALELSMCKALPMSGTLLQLQSLTQRPVSMLEEITSWLDVVQKSDNDEEAISNCAERLQMMADRRSTYTELFDTLLRCISVPWASSIMQDLGIATGSILSASKLEYDINDIYGTFQNSKKDMEIRIKDLPSHLISASDKELIASIRSCMSLLDHRSTTEKYTLAKPLPSASSTLRTTASVEMDLVGDDSPFGVGQLDMRVADLPSSSEQSSTSEPWSPLLDALVKPDVLSSNQELLLYRDVNIDPFQQMRPLLSARKARLSFEALQFICLTHNLREHLELQFRYHLFGSDDFVCRLSTALFSANTQSSERRRGNIPTSEIIGLNLNSSHDRPWPPASSEVRLALANLLQETSDTAFSNSNISAPDRVDILNCLSFSIRELPDLEIERVLDPKSIHALDFLRLQYTAPGPLRQIFTGEAMNWYDNIFRFLLQALRMKHVIANLQMNLLKNKQRQSHSTMFGFAREAGHVVTVLLSHFIDVGIRTPWQNFMQTFERAEEHSRHMPLSFDESSVEFDLTTLYTRHGQCLDEIRARLFLHKRQTPIREAIEKVFTCILDLSPARDADMVLYLVSDLSVATQILMEELRKISSIETLSRRSRSAYSVSTQESFSLLLARLRVDIFD